MKCVPMPPRGLWPQEKATDDMRHGGIVIVLMNALKLQEEMNVSSSVSAFRETFVEPETE